MRKNHGKWLYVLLALTLMFIWGNSMMPSDLSGAFSSFVKELLSKFLGVLKETEGDGVLRKLAHGTEFGVLAAELCLIGVMHKWPKSQVILCGLGVSLIDETIQLFVDGRNGAIRDVWIDMGGFFVGMAICLFVVHRKTGREAKRNCAE